MGNFGTTTTPEPIIRKPYEALLDTLLETLPQSLVTSYTHPFPHIPCGQISNWVTYSLEEGHVTSTCFLQGEEESDAFHNRANEAQSIAQCINTIQKQSLPLYEGDRSRMTRWFVLHALQRHGSLKSKSLEQSKGACVPSRFWRRRIMDVKTLDREFSLPFSSTPSSEYSTDLPQCHEYGDIHTALAGDPSSMSPPAPNISTNDLEGLLVLNTPVYDNPLTHASSSDTLPSGTVDITVYGSVANHKPFLESDILDFFLPFILDASFLTCLLVCPHWFVTIYRHLQQRLTPIVEAFKLAYSPKHLEFLTTTLSIQPLFTAESHVVRIDLLIYCKVLPECVNKCSQLGYSFSYISVPQPDVQAKSKYQPLSLGEQAPISRSTSGEALNDHDKTITTMSNNSHLPSAIHQPFSNDDQHSDKDTDSPGVIPPYSSTFVADRIKEYQSQFRFETCKRHTRRTIWIQRDICRFHGDELMVATLANVPTVNVDDCLEIPINISNAFGLVNLNSITWKSLIVITAPGEREWGQTCELLRNHHEWYTLDDFQPTTNERLEINDHFGPQWTHLKTDFTGLDITCSRSIYLASQIDEVAQSRRWLGIQSTVVPRKSPIVYPLARLGLDHDRFAAQQVRQGDIIVLYVFQGGSVDI